MKISAKINSMQNIWIFYFLFVYCP